MAFFTEPPPEYGRPIAAASGIARLVAPNPGAMTYRGTNTWLVEEQGGTTIVDPGPADDAHTKAILAAAAGRILRILVTHTHPDHVAGVPALRAATGAPVHGWHAPWAEGFVPDGTLADGQAIGGLVALHTPGHASDHLCFAHAATGSLFTGDHVMSWNTSIVALPDGDMSAYMAGLRRLLDRADTRYLCGHGPVLPEPRALVRAMLGHRLQRESAILAAITDAPRTEPDIAAALYPALEEKLRRAAEYTVAAHLAKLEHEGRALRREGLWASSQA